MDRDGRTRNVVLTGFMGTGKTTTGRALADELGFGFIDTDVLIEARHGSIGDLFRDRGEESFRETERQVAAELGETNGMVISTGGRMMLDPVNTRSLSHNGRVYCLVASPEQIVERVVSGADSIDRPLLAGAAPAKRVVELLTERELQYRQFAQVLTDDRRPEDVAQEIAALVRAQPERIAAAGMGGSYEFIIGSAVLPMICELARIDGPLIVVADSCAHELVVASCPNAERVLVLGVDPIDEFPFEPSTAVVSIGSDDVARIAASAAMRVTGGSLVHVPVDPFDPLGFGIGAYAPPLRAVVIDVATGQSQKGSPGQGHSGPAALQAMIGEIVRSEFG